MLTSVALRGITVQGVVSIFVDSLNESKESSVITYGLKLLFYEMFLQHNRFRKHVA